MAGTSLCFGNLKPVWTQRAKCDTKQCTVWKFKAHMDLEGITCGMNQSMICKFFTQRKEVNTVLISVGQWSSFTSVFTGVVPNGFRRSIYTLQGVTLLSVWHLASSSVVIQSE